MSPFRCMFLMMFLVASLCRTDLLGQDSVRVVILSKRVGPEISLTARNTFRLFGQTKDFYCATVYQRPDSTFFVRFVEQRSDGTRRDTMIDYPSTVLRMMAEKINHFEELDEGTYHIGTDPAVLSYDAGGLVSLPSLKETVPQAPIARRVESEPLPLVPDSISEDLFDDGRMYWWIGTGFSWYSANFGGLEESYRAVEAELQALGASESHLSPEFSGSGILWLDLRVRLVGHLLGTLEAGTQITSGTEVKSVSIGLQYNLPNLGAGGLHPFMAVGFGEYKIHAEQGYNIPLGNGGTFEALVVEASRLGILLTAGMELGTRSVVNISASYLYVPALRQTTPLGTVARMNMSSFLVSAKLFLAWY